MSHPANRFGAIHPDKIIPCIEAGQMSTRRMAYWWFRFVASGRFLATFMEVLRVTRR
jgi:hypothetical protein